MLLRAGNAGSNTAADHITVTRAALRQLPGHRPGIRPGRRMLIRTDGAGCTHEFLAGLVRQRLSYSVGFLLPADTEHLLTTIPARAWTPAYDGDGEPRDGAWVAEAPGLLDLTSWPAGMRVILRKERPHPGAQLQITSGDGMRVTAFATTSTRGQLADLKLGHRRRARAEDRSRVEGHRPDQSAAARLHPEPDLVRHRRARRRTDRLAADPRPDRTPGPPRGTETAPPTAVLHRRPANPHRPAHHAAPVPTRPLGRPAHRRDHTPRALPEPG